MPARHIGVVAHIGGMLGDNLLGVIDHKKGQVPQPSFLPEGNGLLQVGDLPR